MFFSKSIAFDREETAKLALVGSLASAGSSADSEFIERLKSGDSEAFDVLVTRYTGDIYALLYRLTENSEDARDLTQETFLSALKAIKSFRGDAQIKTWLYRIAINKSRNRFRWWKRRKRDVTISLDAPYGSSETPLSETVSSDSDNPEEAALKRERALALKRALSELPVIYREAVILCDIEGLKYEEIAEALAINIGTVKSRIARGRDELRKRLKDI